MLQSGISRHQLAVSGCEKTVRAACRPDALPLCDEPVARGRDLRAACRLDERPRTVQHSLVVATVARGRDRCAVCRQDEGRGQSNVR